MATKFMGYTGHPLSWERTDMGRPLMKVAVLIIGLAIVGFAVAYLLAALTQVAPAPMFKGHGEYGGLFGGEGPLVFFMLLVWFGFMFPTNMFVIFVVALPILGLIQAWKAFNNRPPRPVERRRSAELGPMRGFLGR